MEPLFFKAENAATWQHHFGQPIASMEPLFFKAENALCLYFGIADSLLQWSRFFSKRKMATGRPVAASDRLDGFNGAAFFQSGKSKRSRRGRLGEREGFNGAAFFQSGK